MMHKMRNFARTDVWHKSSPPVTDSVGQLANACVQHPDANLLPAHRHRPVAACKLNAESELSSLHCKPTGIRLQAARRLHAGVMGPSPLNPRHKRSSVTAPYHSCRKAIVPSLPQQPHCRLHRYSVDRRITALYKNGVLQQQPRHAPARRAGQHMHGCRLDTRRQITSPPFDTG
jgi:hypothetical protein